MKIIGLILISLILLIAGCSNNNSTGPRINVHSRFEAVPDSVADSLGMYK